MRAVRSRLVLAAAILAASGETALAQSEPPARPQNEKAPFEKSQAPIPAATLALIQAKGSTASAPILFRAFKKESEIELWKRAGDGRFVRIKTYPICRWSGQLGPKTRSGDRQTPEGFYSVAPNQMNPRSHYYLSFDVGYPNALDRSLGYTGSAVMVHGICSSMGCFAMTDAVAGELFSVAREAFAGGQSAFQFQSFPFRMSAANMARYRTDPSIAFWRQLKQGSDRFEATRREPVVLVAGGRYAFAPLADPAEEAAAEAYRRDQEREVATLIENGSAAIRTTYADGGQHAFWAGLIAKGVPVGEVSRPEALAFAGQEVTLIPARPKPPPVPAAVWAVWIAPATPFHPASLHPYVPPFELAAPTFPPLVTGYVALQPHFMRTDLGAFAQAEGAAASLHFTTATRP